MRISEIISPSIKAHLLALASHLKLIGYGVVEDLGIRLTLWIDGNDRGQFILDHYTNMGFYYVNVTGITNSNDLKPTIHFQLKNLFTDEIILSSGFARFKPLQSGGALEAENYTSAQFQQFQSMSGLATFNDWIKPEKIIFARTAVQFIETITPGGGGGGITPGGGGNGLPAPGTQPNVITSGNDFLSQYGLYIGLGLLAFMFMNQKGN